MRALGTGACLPQGRETPGVDVPGDDLLVWHNLAWGLQGQAENCTKTLRQALARFPEWLRRYRNLRPTGDLLRRAKVRVQRHLNYDAMTDNAESCYRSRH